MSISRLKVPFSFLLLLFCCFRIGLISCNQTVLELINKAAEGCDVSHLKSTYDTLCNFINEDLDQQRYEQQLPLLSQHLVCKVFYQSLKEFCSNKQPDVAKKAQLEASRRGDVICGRQVQNMTYPYLKNDEKIRDIWVKLTKKYCAEICLPYGVQNVLCSFIFGINSQHTASTAEGKGKNTDSDPVEKDNKVSSIADSPDEGNSKVPSVASSAGKAQPDGIIKESPEKQNTVQNMSNRQIPESKRKVETVDRNQNNGKGSQLDKTGSQEISGDKENKDPKRPAGYNRPSDVVSSEIPAPQGFSEPEESSRLFWYFLTFATLGVICYCVMCQKKKILALLIEGRKVRGTRRRPNTAAYTKLNNLEEAMMSKPPTNSQVTFNY